MLSPNFQAFNAQGLENRPDQGSKMNIVFNDQNPQMIDIDAAH
jgi:hypothetical protein